MFSEFKTENKNFWEKPNYKCYIIFSIFQIIPVSKKQHEWH